MTDEQLAQVVTRARKLCGCVQCHGGYEIGARTIGNPVRGTELRAAPSGCLAAVILPLIKGE